MSFKDVKAGEVYRMVNRGAGRKTTYILISQESDGKSARRLKPVFLFSSEWSKGDSSYFLSTDYGMEALKYLNKMAARRETVIQKLGNLSELLSEFDMEQD